MTDGTEDPDELVRAWAGALDEIDYFGLLGLPSSPEPTDDEVRTAWRSFALAFHPDRRRDAPEDVRAAATRIFQRGVEAYGVLSNASVRARYVASLARGGSVRMSQGEAERARREGDGSSARAVVGSAAARPFAEKADEFLATGKLEAARLQLQLASMREPGNEGLGRLLRKVEEQLASARRPR